ncbi:hypothetical protein [uncultured Microbulbifer sp.]|uniref:hypothetical protein n=1 Tax=uncultured Microbulbifer sp. TaxID=348147 RepID=UPI002611CB16|nr:hypothetical protein [uncultured Microbulbifer sp.]
MKVMDWPSDVDCYQAMAKFASYYMQAEQQEKWLSIIADGLETGAFPPGKGFLYEIDKAIKSSPKSSMPNREDLYQLICTVCI